MTILSALKESNANQGFLYEGIPHRDDYPAPPPVRHRKLSRILHRYDAFIIQPKKLRAIVSNAIEDKGTTPKAFIDSNRKRIYVYLQKDIKPLKQDE